MTTHLRKGDHIEVDITKDKVRSVVRRANGRTEMVTGEAPWEDRVRHPMEDDVIPTKLPALDDSQHEDGER